MKKAGSVEKTGYTAPVVQKTIMVLNKIATAARNPGVSEIASDVSLPKSTTHGILAALEGAGWVLRDPISRRYTCGHAFLDLTATGRVRLPLLEVGRPYLEKLEIEVDQDVFLGIRTSDHLLILHEVESSKRLKVRTRPGTCLPLFAGAAGKIFLAHMEKVTVSKLVRSSRLRRFTARSIVEPDDYLRELEKVRQEGFALDMEEYIPDVRAVAVPIFCGKGIRKRMVAGIWVVGLSSELHNEKIKEVALLTLRTGELISHALTRRSSD